RRKSLNTERYANKHKIAAKTHILKYPEINHRTHFSPRIPSMKRANSAPESGFYREIINTDDETYGGSNIGNLGGLQSEAREWMGREYSILVHLPPLATLAFKLEK